MIDKNNFPMRLEGKSVILEEIQPKYFPYVVKWRNDKNLNRFLNQSFELTLELEKKWYEEVYLNDDTQSMTILIDKANGTPFGTFGHTDLDLKKRRCIGGRMLIGDERYNKHPAFFESLFLGSDETYKIVDVIYIHVVKNNRKALRLNKMMGYLPNEGQIQYPHELFRNGMEQVEWYRTKEMYLNVRHKLFEQLGDSLFT